MDTVLCYPTTDLGFALVLRMRSMEIAIHPGLGWSGVQLLDGCALHCQYGEQVTGPKHPLAYLAFLFPWCHGVPAVFADLFMARQ